MESKLKLATSHHSGTYLGQLQPNQQMTYCRIEFNRIAEIAKHGENTAVTVLNSLASVAHYRSINEPIVHQGRGRPVGSISNLNSTRRDPSLFEHIEGAKGRRRCLKCKGIGHNSRTCTVMQK